jgi:hypothetical protein
MEHQFTANICTPRVFVAYKYTQRYIRRVGLPTTLPTHNTRHPISNSRRTGAFGKLRPASVAYVSTGLPAIRHTTRPHLRCSGRYVPEWAAMGKKRADLKYRKSVDAQHPSTVQNGNTEQTLARWVALAFAADNPALFRRASRTDSTFRGPSASSEAEVIPLDGSAADERAPE